MESPDPISTDPRRSSIRLPRQFYSRLAGTLIAVGIVWSLAVAVRHARHDAEKSSCKGKLSQISLALSNYHADYGCYPPAYVADENGRPMHSWRVLLLPYWDAGDFYRRYSFDEPWDGPNNRKLAEEANSPCTLYHCPSDRHETGGADNSKMTSYVVILSPETAWNGTRSASRIDITDDPAGTPLVVEVANSGIHWMEPRDLDMSEMAPKINSKTAQGISSRHHLGAWCILADGGVRFLPDNLTPERLRILLTIRGGENPNVKEEF
jgi:hypothetical protein